MYDVESVVLNCIFRNKYYFLVFILDIYRLLFVNSTDFREVEWFGDGGENSWRVWKPDDDEEEILQIEW